MVFQLKCKEQETRGRDVRVTFHEFLKSYSVYYDVGQKFGNNARSMEIKN